MATQTQTVPAITTTNLKLSTVDDLFETRLPANFLAGLEKLSRAQAGHLRHFHNLATQPDDEWLHMGGQDHGQEWVDGYRYQLATMAYATGAAHYHRLPVLRSVFRTLLEKPISKMLRKEVWGYWFLTSHGGIKTDPSLTELRRPWSDPIKKENIMYSGHLLMMVSLYAMLFDSRKYDGESALVFNWNPVFWGMGDEKYSYSRMELQKIILEEMEKKAGSVSAASQIASLLLATNFPLIAIRYNDVRNGTSIAEDVVKKYKAAWEAKKGPVQEDGLFANLILSKQGVKIPASDIGLTAWACAFINAWSPEVVSELYPKQSLGYLSRVSHDRVNLNPPAIAQAFRSLVTNDGLDPNALSTLAKAKELAQRIELPGPVLPYKEPIFGKLDDVRPFHPDGVIGYARLNVPGGQRKMWEKPWNPTDVANAPFVDEVDLSTGVDFSRGIWLAERGAMVMTMSTWHGVRTRIQPVCRNLPIGIYGVYVNGQLSEIRHVDARTVGVKLDLEVDSTEQDVVLLKARLNSM